MYTGKKNSEYSGLFLHTFLTNWQFSMQVYMNPDFFWLGLIKETMRKSRWQCKSRGLGNPGIRQQTQDLALPSRTWNMDIVKRSWKSRLKTSASCHQWSYNWVNLCIKEFVCGTLINNIFSSFTILYIQLFSVPKTDGTQKVGVNKFKL